MDFPDDERETSAVRAWVLLILIGGACWALAVAFQFAGYESFKPARVKLHHRIAMGFGLIGVVLLFAATIAQQN